MAVTVAALPTARVESPVLVALPLDKVTALPKFTPLVWNWTVPVRVPAPGATGLTVAVKVTDWPNTDGLVEEVSVVVVPAWPIVWARAEEVFVLKLVLPLYTAVRLCEPMAKAELVKVTWPEVRVLVASAVAPSF